MDLFEQFCKEKEYLQGCSPRTIKYFRFCFMSWKRVLGDSHLNAGLPTKHALKAYVISLREAGVSIPTTNSYIRGLNSYFTWLHENNHTPEKLRLQPLKAPQTVLKVFSDSQVKSLLSFKPRTFHQHRVYAMLCIAVDTGCRIDELISLEKSAIDLDNLLITVKGKGQKERKVPISLEARKVLYKFITKHDFDFAFPTKHGGKVYYRSALDQLKKLCKKQGVNGVRTSWHTLRHGFAINHVRQGGDVFSLQRMMGHSSLEITRRYVNMNEEDLKLVHKKTSMLSRLRA